MMLKDNRGSLLLEALIVISILSVVVMFGSQLFLTSARSSKWSRERDVADGLAIEALEAVKSVATESWLNVYMPPDGTGDPNSSKGTKLRLVQNSGKWEIASGQENVNMDGIAFARSFIVENVSRDENGNIENTYNSLNDDPSTQKITISISWLNDSVTMNEYITRWRNKICVQTDWSGGQTTGTSTCPANTYTSIDNEKLDTGGGNLKLKPL